MDLQAIEPLITESADHSVGTRNQVVQSRTVMMWQLPEWCVRCFVDYVVDQVLGTGALSAELVVARSESLVYMVERDNYVEGGVADAGVAYWWSVVFEVGCQEPDGERWDLVLLRHFREG
jgi:hypothetical protein